MCVVDVRVRLRSSVGILDEALDLTADLCTALFLQKTMLQELVVHSCAIAHYQKLRCRSLVKVPITLLKVIKENDDIFNSCQEVFRNLPQHRSESSVLDSVIVRYKVSYLDGVLVMQHQFWVPTATMALYVNRDTLELLGSMMPHLCGPSNPAASTVVVHSGIPNSSGAVAISRTTNIAAIRQLVTLRPLKSSCSQQN